MSISTFNDLLKWHDPHIKHLGMSDLCHLDSALVLKVKYLLLSSFLTVAEFYNSRYYKGALTQKRSFLVICTTFRFDFYVGWKNQNKHSTLNSSFHAMSKWHEPDISHQADATKQTFGNFSGLHIRISGSHLCFIRIYQVHQIIFRRFRPDFVSGKFFLGFFPSFSK